MGLLLSLPLSFSLGLSLNCISSLGWGGGQGSAEKEGHVMNVGSCGGASVGSRLLILSETLQLEVKSRSPEAGGPHSIRRLSYKKKILNTYDCF